MSSQSKPAWWYEPSTNAFAKGMTTGELIMDWLDRNDVGKQGNKFIFFHGTPKANKTLRFLKKGSLLETKASKAAEFSAHNRYLNPSTDVIVFKILVDPWQINTGMWASLRADFPVSKTSIVKVV